MATKKEIKTEEVKTIAVDLPKDIFEVPMNTFQRISQYSYLVFRLILLEHHHQQL